MRIFLAAPFTGYITAGEGPTTFDPQLRRLITTAIVALEDAGHEVFSAHRLEDFGSGLRSADEATIGDFVEMVRCDVLVVLGPPSYGVHIELGWASALGKPIVLGPAVSVGSTPLFEGLAELAAVRRPWAEDGWGWEQTWAKRLVEEVIRVPPAGVVTLAFVSSSFGFGPTAKAVAIARAVQKANPAARCFFLGSGISLEFANRSRVFFRTIDVDTDTPEGADRAAIHLRSFDVVCNVLGLGLLSRWTEVTPPMVFVDSLAWMWADEPIGANRAHRYLAQDYLLETTAPSALGWQLGRTERIAPIIDRSLATAQERRPGRLAINISGASNPLSDGTIYKTYVEAMVGGVLSADAGFDEVIVCGNDRLVRALPDAPRLVRAGHLAPEAFRELMTSASLLLTSPGITTTLEAVSTVTPIGFLLPQNYSQALMAEHYRASLGDAHVIAFSQFGLDCVPDPSVEESMGVAHVVRTLDHLLLERPHEVLARTRELVNQKAGLIATEKLGTRVAADCGADQVANALIEACCR